MNNFGIPFLNQFSLNEVQKGTTADLSSLQDEISVCFSGKSEAQSQLEALTLNQQEDSTAETAEELSSSLSQEQSALTNCISTVSTLTSNLSSATANVASAMSTLASTAQTIEQETTNENGEVVVEVVENPDYQAALAAYNEALKIQNQAQQELQQAQEELDAQNEIVLQLASQLASLDEKDEENGSEEDSEIEQLRQIISDFDTQIQSLQAQIEEIQQEAENTKLETQETQTQQNTKTEETQEAQNVEELINQQTTNEMEELASKYLGKPLAQCTQDELDKAYAIEMFNSDYGIYNQMYNEQLQNDGAISDGYNAFKEFTDLGISREDVENAMAEQNEMNQALIAALNGESDETFEEVYKKYTGVEFDNEKIIEYQQAKNIYDFSMAGVQKASSFTQAAQSAKSTEELLDLYTQYYGDETKAREEISQIILESNALSDAKNIRIDEENNIYVESIDGEEYLFSELNGVDIGCDLFNPLQSNEYSEKYINEYKEKFEQATGLTYDEITENLVSTKQEAIGKGDKFQNMVEKYCESQEGFIDKVAAVGQVGGMAITATGGVLVSTGIGSGAGAFMVSAGTKISISSLYLDNALESVDILTSDRDDKLSALGSEAIDAGKDTGFLFLGMGINALAGKTSSLAMENAASALNTTTDNLAVKALGTLTEIGTDASMSLLSDYILTGECNLEGEALSQLMGIVVGNSRGKVETYKQDILDDMNLKLENGKTTVVDIVKEMEKAGFTKEEIEAFKNANTGEETGAFWNKKKQKANPEANVEVQKPTSNVVTLRNNQTVDTIDSKTPYKVGVDSKVKIGDTEFKLDDLLKDLPEGTYRVGNGVVNDIQINDPKVSRNHLEITKTKDGYIVKDLGSRFGTSLKNIETPQLREDQKILLKKDGPNLTCKAGENASVCIGNGEYNISDLLKDQPEGTYTIGRGSDNDIRINDPKVSTNHLKITKTKDGYIVKDLGSLNGTLLKNNETPQLYTGQEINLKKGGSNLTYKVGENTSVCIGDGEYNISDLLKNQPEGTYTIGRGSDNDIPINDPKVSKNHLVITKTKDGYFVTDLESKNGTKLKSLSPEQYIDNLSQIGVYIEKPQLKAGESSELDQNYVDDLAKLYYGELNGKTTEEIFTPKYSNATAAANELKVGDVCSIGNSDSAYIKLKDGRMQKLNMSTATYLQLFPPVTRFASKQMNIGDCFLISPLDAIYKDPETRYKLLSCFKEKSDGSLEVKIGGVKKTFSRYELYNYQPTYDSKTHILGQQRGLQYNIQGGTGFKMLEDTFGTYYLDKKIKNTMDKLAYLKPGSEEYKKTQEKLLKLQNSKEYNIDTNVYGRDFGRLSDTFKAFGIEAYDEGVSNALDKIGSNSDDYIITAGTLSGSDKTFINKDKQIVYGHAYVIKPVTLASGEIIYRATNPWNCVESIFLTRQEMEEYFSCVTIALK